MSQKWFNNIDLQQNELQNGVIQNLAADPTSGKAGQIYYNTTDKGYRYHNGTAWVSITAEAVKSIKAGNGLTSTGTDTVTISLGDPSASGAASGTTYGSNGVTETSHTHQVRISAATTDTPGVIELATDAEATAGTDTTRAINAKQLAAAKQSAINSAKVTIQTSNGITGGSTTPGNSFALSGVDALTTAKGVVQLATQDEVNAGTDAKKVITPATLRKGKASGVASLDANSKIITSQLPDYLLGQVMYGGNASEVATTTTISPSDSLKTKKNITTTSISIVNSATSTDPNKYGYKDMEGVYFICQAKGTFAETSFEKGDWIISTGAKWEKIDNTDAVKSVNGKIGDVNITRVNEAGTADKLKTARTIALTGDATGSTTFDGSANEDINVTLANTGVTAGTYNNVTVDAKGRVVSASNIKTSVVSEITGNGTQKEFDIAHSLGKNVIVQVFLNGQQIGSDTVDELIGVDVYTTNEKVKLVFATPPSTSQKFKVVISSGGNGVESLTPTAANDDMVAIADSTAATGWKFGKIKTENLENGKVERAEYLSGWARHFVTVLLSKGSGASYSDFRIYLEVLTRSFEQITTMSQLIAAVRSSGSVVLATGVGYVGTGAGIPDAYNTSENILENRVYNVLRVYYEDHITAASCCVSIVKTTVSNISSEGFDVNTVTMNAFDDIFISDMVSTLLAG